MTDQQVSPLVYRNMMADQSKERVISAIKDIVSADEIVEKVRFRFTGKKKVQTFNEKTGKPEVHWVQYHQPLMNDYGCDQVISDFETFINTNIVLSYLEKDDIQKRSEAYFTNIIFELARNMINYGIFTKERHAKIRTILGQNFHSALKRSYNGMTILNALKNISVNEVRNLEADPLRSRIQNIFAKT